MREESAHFREMLKERNISKTWVDAVLNDPENVERAEDGTTHYVKRIEEYGGRWLRVIVNENKVPPKIITAFFDRRLRRQLYEGKNR